MPPWIHHFIVRPEHVKRTATGLVVERPLVPLIAVDELPPWLDIIGIPRQLAAEQTAGLSNLGCFERQGVHDVEIIIDGPDDAGVDDDGAAGGEQAAGGAATDGRRRRSAAATAPPGLAKSRWAAAAVPAETSTAAGTDKDAAQQQQPTIPATAPQAAVPSPAVVAAAAAAAPATTLDSSATTSQQQPTHPALTATTDPPPKLAPLQQQPPPPPTRPSHHQPQPPPPPQHRRISCRHWCRHGTCKWGAHCRFAHAMPTTAAGLAEVGLREFPGWWTAAMAAAAAVLGLHGSGGGGGGGSSASAVMPPDVALRRRHREDRKTAGGAARSRSREARMVDGQLHIMQQQQHVPVVHVPATLDLAGVVGPLRDGQGGLDGCYPWFGRRGREVHPRERMTAGGFGGTEVGVPAGNGMGEMPLAASPQSQQQQQQQQKLVDV